MTRFALYVELKAKPGREEDVATFLANARALVLAETGTVAWFAVRFDKATFAIFDAFNDEAGRTAHLNGAVAAALMANAADLLAVAPRYANQPCWRTSFPRDCGADVSGPLVASYRERTNEDQSRC